MSSMTATTLVMNTTSLASEPLQYRQYPSPTKVLPLFNSKQKLQTPVLGARPKLRQTPRKTNSYDKAQRLSSLFRGNDSAPILPDRSPETHYYPLKVKHTGSGESYRASERGSQSILPVATPRTPLRSRRTTAKSVLSQSFSGFESKHADRVPISPNQLRSSAKSLRSRKRTSSANLLNETGSHISDDASITLYELEENFSPSRRSRSPMYSDDCMDDDDDDDQSMGADKKSRPPTTMFFSKLKSSATDGNNMWQSMKPPQLITLLLLFAMTCFVAGSYRQVLSMSEEIEAGTGMETKLLVHLHTVEQQALELAENLHRMNDQAGGSHLVAEDGERGVTSSAAQVDSDLIRAQVEKLRDMEAELDHEVRALRKTIQHSAQQSLISHYGEGAVQVFLEVETLEQDIQGNLVPVPKSKDRKDTLAIRLWYDTPHTGWTFLQQIEQGAWNGAVFSIDGGRSLMAEPARKGGDNIEPVQPSLDFLEPSERGFDRYTVTLTDQNLVINLQDNKRFQKQEGCVGIIYEGYDVLHGMVQDTNHQSTKVRIRKATASHLTR